MRKNKFTFYQALFFVGLFSMGCNPKPEMPDPPIDPPVAPLSLQLCTEDGVCIQNPAGQVRTGALRSSKDIWVAGDQGQIWHYDGTKWRLTYYQTGVVWSGVYAASDTEVWAIGKNASNESLLYQWNGKIWSPFAWQETKEQFVGIQGNGTHIWLLTYSASNAATLYQIQDGELKKFSTNKEMQPYALFVAVDETVWWVGQDTQKKEGVLFQKNKQNDTLWQVQVPFVKDSIALTSIFGDKNGNIWVRLQPQSGVPFFAFFQKDNLQKWSKIDAQGIGVDGAGGICKSQPTGDFECTRDVQTLTGKVQGMSWFGNTSDVGILGIDSTGKVMVYDQQLTSYELPKGWTSLPPTAPSMPAPDFFSVSGVANPKTIYALGTKGAVWHCNGADCDQNIWKRENVGSQVQQSKVFVMGENDVFRTVDGVGLFHDRGSKDGAGNSVWELVTPFSSNEKAIGMCLFENDMYLLSSNQLFGYDGTKTILTVGVPSGMVLTALDCGWSLLYVWGFKDGRAVQYYHNSTNWIQNDFAQLANAKFSVKRSALASYDTFVRTYLDTENNLWYSYLNTNPYQFFKMLSGTVAFGSVSGGIWSISPELGFGYYDRGSSVSGSLNVKAAMKDSSQFFSTSEKNTHVWLVGSQGGIGRVVVNHSKNPLKSREFWYPAEVKQIQPVSLSANENGTVVASHGNEVFQLQQEGSWSTLKTRTDLQSDYVSATAAAKEGGFWALSLNNQNESRLLNPSGAIVGRMAHTYLQALAVTPSDVWAVGGEGLLHHQVATKQTKTHFCKLGINLQAVTIKQDQVWAVGSKGELVTVENDQCVVKKQILGNPSMISVQQLEGSLWGLSIDGNLYDLLGNPTPIKISDQKMQTFWVDSKGRGFLVGEKGAIWLKESGKNWRALRSGTTQDLLAIGSDSQGTVWFLGKEGHLLRYQEKQ